MPSRTFWFHHLVMYSKAPGQLPSSLSRSLRLSLFWKNDITSANCTYNFRTWRALLANVWPKAKLRNQSQTGFITLDDLFYWCRAILTLCQLICYHHLGPWDLITILVLAGMTCDAFMDCSFRPGGHREPSLAVFLKETCTYVMWALCHLWT